MIAGAKPENRQPPSSTPGIREAGGELSTLFHQSSHYVLGIAATLALGFVSFPLFTRMFSVADYGLIDFAQKIILLVTTIGKAGMQNSAIRFYDRKVFAGDPARERSYYSTLFFGVGALAIAVTLVFAVLSAALSGPLAKLLLFGSALISIRALQSILWAFLRVEERTRTYNVLTVVMRAATIASILLLIPATGVSVRTYFLGMMGVELAVLLYGIVPLIRRGLLHVHAVRPELLQSSVAFGLPLVMQELFGIVLDSGDRAVVRHYLGADALGFYSVAYGLSTYVNNFLVAPLGLAIAPIYMRLWNEEGPAKTAEFLGNALDVFFMVAAAVMAVVWVSAHDVMVVLASAKYQGADRLMPAIVAGLLMYTTQVFANAGLIIQKKTRLLGAAVAISAALNIGLNILLVPRIGLDGAALATLWSYAFCSVLIAVLSFRFLALKIHVVRLAGYLLAGTAAVWVGGRLDVGVPAVNAVLKTSAVLGAYLIVLAALDSRLRAWGALVWNRLRRTDAAPDRKVPAAAGTQHLLFVFDQLSHLNGGAERALLKLVRLLPPDRFRVSVATFCAPRNETALEPLGCPVHCFPISKCVSTEGLKVAWKLRKIIREERVAIVQTFFASSDLWGSVIARLSGCRIIVSSRRDMGFQLTPKHKMAYRLLGPNFNKIHTVSDAVREFTIRQDRIDPGKVVTIPNGVSVPPVMTPAERELVRSRFGIAAGAQVVVDVGNISAVKGFDVLVRAASIVCRTLPDTIFLIVGQEKDPEYTRRLKEQVAALGLTANVRFAGAQADPMPILQAADLFCHLSSTDGLSNALLEAMSAGLPTVISNVGGNPEVVNDGWNGFIVDATDHEAAARNIRTLLDSPELTRQMGDRSREIVQNRFTDRHMADQFITIYDELLQSMSLKGFQ